MAVEIIQDKETGKQAMFCNTTDIAFGPIFRPDENVEHFIDWLKWDARSYGNDKLLKKQEEWRQETQQEPPGPLFFIRYHDDTSITIRAESAWDASIKALTIREKDGLEFCGKMTVKNVSTGKYTKVSHIIEAC